MSIGYEYDDLYMLSHVIMLSELTLIFTSDSLNESRLADKNKFTSLFYTSHAEWNLASVIEYGLIFGRYVIVNVRHCPPPHEMRHDGQSM